MKDNIYIKINNEFLELPDDIKVQFNLNSPIFGTEVLKGSYSYPFSIPLSSAVNRRLLNRPDDIKNTDPIPERIDVILGLCGKEYDSYLKVSVAVRNGNVSAAAFVKDSALTAARDKSIRSFDLGTIDFSTGSSFKEIHVNWAKTTGFPAPTGADVSIELNSFNYQCAVHPLDPISSSAVWHNCLNNLISQINAQTTINLVTASVGPEVTPGDGFPMLKVVANSPGVSSRLEITKAYSKIDPAFFPFIVYQSYYNNGSVLADYMTGTVLGLNTETRVTWAPMYFDNLYSDDTYDWNHVANYWSGSHFQYLNGTSGVPVITLVYFKFVVTEIFSLLGYSVSGAFFQDPELSKLVFYSTKPADNIQPVMYTPPAYLSIGVRKTNVYADIIPLAEQLPDLSVSKLISLHRNTFAVYYIFNNEDKSVKIGFLKDLIKKPTYIDWNDRALKDQSVYPREATGVTLKYSNDGNDNALKTLIPSLDGYRRKGAVLNFVDLPSNGNQENDLRLVISENYYYQVNYQQVGVFYDWVWTFYSVNLYDFVYESGSLVIESGNSTYLMKNESGIAIPYFDQAASSAPYNQPAINFSPRLMLYRGMQTYGGVTTPSITRTALPSNNYSMEWGGEKGLYEKFYKDWIHFLSNTIPVEKKLNLSKSDFNLLTWDEWHRIEDVPYLIESLNFTVSKTSLSTVTAKLYVKP